MPPVLMLPAVTFDGSLPVVSMLAVCGVHTSVVGSNENNVKSRVFPLPPGVWGASAHAAKPPALIPSAFPPAASMLGVTWVADTGFVPVIAPTATALSLPAVLPDVGRWI